jgi:hypothetical protein
MVEIFVLKRLHDNSVIRFVHDSENDVLESSLALGPRKRHSADLVSKPFPISVSDDGEYSLDIGLAPDPVRG